MLQARRRYLKGLRRKGPKRFYFRAISKRWVMDGAVAGSGAELVNHSCDPNLVTRRVCGHTYYYSRRRIRQGEELTVDYQYAAESRRVVCRCGSPKCRGTINRE